MSTKIKIKGLNELLKKLDRTNKTLVQDVVVVMEAGIREMNVQAQRNIQAHGLIDTGTLLKGQQVVPGNNPRTFTMINDTSYAPYQEFGTGALVEVPPDWADIAIQFKGKGIKQVNIKAKPFFVPAFNQLSPRIVQDVEDVINDSLK